MPYKCLVKSGMLKSTSWGRDLKFSREARVSHFRSLLSQFMHNLNGLYTKLRRAHDDLEVQCKEQNYKQKSSLFANNLALTILFVMHCITFYFKATYEDNSGGHGLCWFI